MDRNTLVPVLGIAIVNGIFSPWVLAVFLLYPLWYPSFALAWTQAVYMASALILSTLTVMAAGVPTALYERFARQPRPAVASAIWIAGVVIMTLPAIPNVLRALGAG
jgi:hypothetical protein